MGCPSLLVLTGVTSPAELLAATPRQRPTYVASDVRGLLAVHPDVELASDAASCGSWRATVPAGNGAVVRLGQTDGGAAAPDGGAAAPDGDSDLDALRALCGAVWSSDVAYDELQISGESDAAGKVLDRLGLT